MNQNLQSLETKLPEGPLVIIEGKPVRTGGTCIEVYDQSKKPLLVVEGIPRYNILVVEGEHKNTPATLQNVASMLKSSHYAPTFAPKTPIISDAMYFVQKLNERAFACKNGLTV